MLIQRTNAGLRRAQGFTLIELMIAIALLGTLMALGLPALTQWIRNSQVRTVTDALQSGIRLAQSEAVRRNRTMVFSLTNAQPALSATAVASGKNWSLQTIMQFGETSAEFVQGGALAEVASAVTIAGPAAVCFNSNGRLAAVTSANTGVSGATCSVTNTQYDVSLTNADRPLRVTVGLAGQVRLCDWHRPTLSDTSPDGCP